MAHENMRNFEDFVRYCKEMLISNVHVDELFLRTLKENNNFILLRGQIITELQEATKSLEILKRILSNKSATPTIHESSSENGGNSSFEMSALHLEEELAETQLIDIDEDTNDSEQGEEEEEDDVVEEEDEGCPKNHSLSSHSSFIKNEKICFLLQKQDEMEKLNESLRRDFQGLQEENKSHEESLIKMAKKLLGDLKEVGASLENNHIVADIENGEDGTLGEKFTTMRLCISKINADIRKLKQMNVMIKDFSIANADKHNLTAKSVEGTLNRRPKRRSSEDSYSFTPSKKPANKKRTVDEEHEVNSSLGSEKLKLNLIGKAKGQVTRVRGADPYASVSRLSGVNAFDLVRSSHKKNYIFINADGTFASLPTQLNMHQVEDNFENRTDVELLGKNKHICTENTDDEEQNYKSTSTSEEENVTSDDSDSSSPSEHYCCETCDLKFKWKQGLRWHDFFWHTDRRPARKCPCCPKSFQHSNEMKSHIRKAHNRITLFQCDRCSRAFEYRHHLDHHIRKKHIHATKNNHSHTT